MKRRSMLIALALGSVLTGAACWPFEEGFQQCVADQGNCDCPTGEVQDGMCLMRLHTRNESWYSSVWGSAPDNVWSGGAKEQVTRYEGASFQDSAAYDAFDTAAWIYRFAGTGPSDVWAMGGYYLAHSNGTTWSLVDDQNAYYDGDAPAPGELYTAGPSGIHHVSPGGAPVLEFDPSTSFSQTIYGIRAFDTQRAVAVSGDSWEDFGYLLTRESDAGWGYELVTDGGQLRAVGGPSENDLWVAGDNGVVLHKTDAGWQQVRAPGATFEKIWVSNDGRDVWLTDESYAFRYNPDAGAVEQVHVPGLDDEGSAWITGVWGNNDGTVWLSAYDCADSNCAYFGHAYMVQLRPMP